MTGGTTAEHEDIRLINELDLEPIVFKLTVSEHGEPAKMTLAEADAAIVQYRQFLTLSLLYPGSSIVPTRTIDEVWHTHILDTAKYAEDCQRIFGRMMHHFPYLGLRGPEDVERWHAAFQRTCDLFLQHFGVTLATDMGACGESCKESLCDGGSCDKGSCDAPPAPPTDSVSLRLVAGECLPDTPECTSACAASNSTIDRSRPRPNRATLLI